MPPHTYKRAAIRSALVDHDQQAQKAVLESVAKGFYREMMDARPWRCAKCCAPAIGLSCHPMAYLHLAEPRIEDMPDPFCSKVRRVHNHRSAFRSTCAS
jgi:hypothetical protein